MQDQMVPSELYDEAYYRTHCGGHEDFSRGELSPRLQKAWQMAPPHAGQKVLDVGCGRGELCVEIARVGATAIGIDYAEEGVRIASEVSAKLPQQLQSKITIERADVTALPYEDSSFDLAFMLDVVEHLYPAQLQAGLTEIARVLKPGGKLIIHTAPNPIHKATMIPLYRRWVAALSFPVANRLFGSSLSITQTIRNPEDDRLHVNEQTWWSLGRVAKKSQMQGRVWSATYPLNRKPAEVLFYITQYLWPLSTLFPFSVVLSNDVWAVLTPKKK